MSSFNPKETSSPACANSRWTRTPCEGRKATIEKSCPQQSPQTPTQASQRKRPSPRVKKKKGLRPKGGGSLLQKPPKKYVLWYVCSPLCSASMCVSAAVRTLQFRKLRGAASRQFFVVSFSGAFTCPRHLSYARGLRLSAAKCF